MECIVLELHYCVKRRIFSFSLSILFVQARHVPPILTACKWVSPFVLHCLFADRSFHLILTLRPCGYKSISSSAPLSLAANTKGKCFFSFCNFSALNGLCLWRKLDFYFCVSVGAEVKSSFSKSS